MTNSAKASSKNSPTRLTLLSVLAFAGTLVAGYQSKHYYGLRAGTEGFRSFCNLGSTMNCDAVALSSYADLFPGWPLSSFAAGWFLALLIVSLVARSSGFRREALRVAFAMTAVALLASSFYFYVMVSVIGTYCLLCLVVDGLSVLSFVTLATFGREIFQTKKVDWAQWRTLALSGAAALFVGVLAMKGFEARSMDRGTMNVLVREVIESAPLSVGAGPEFPSMGPADAPITIVEFADFQCPSCRLGAITMKSVLNRFPGRVRVVFRHFPANSACNASIPGGGHVAACEAAKVAICSRAEGKFDQVSEALFENQASLAPGKVLEVARKAGISEALAGCIDLPETAHAITVDTEEAARLGVRATPTFFINGHKVEGAYPLDAWVQLIEYFSSH